ncbi:MAG: galactose/glucose ABC transporter substrate-binding protein MglB [Spirochaetales bacterium]|jgi:methyl-galactoside transport system substrate-binding protein|nr:galactose/glucose ABC transporter substrate-binding protein MglB [Spirochaetales bacterium]
MKNRSNVGAAALAVLAVCLAAWTLTGCAKNSDKPRIGVAIYKFDDTFMSTVRNAISKAGEENATVEIVDSQNAQPTQNDQIDNFISRSVKALAINPVDRTAAAVIIQKAKAADVPVVFFNREPLASDMQAWDKIYYVGARAEESGTYQGQIAVDYFRGNPGADKNGDGVIQYIMIMGEPGHQDAELRTEYSVKAITDAGLRVEQLARDTAMWDRVRGQEKMSAFLAAHGERIELVLCNNDDMALGAIEALKAEGYNTGGAKYIPVIGVDATAPALEAIENGTLLGTVLNDGQNQGQAAYDIAFAVATGANPSSTGWTLDGGKYVWVPYQMVTRANYLQFK